MGYTADEWAKRIEQVEMGWEWGGGQPECYPKLVSLVAAATGSFSLVVPN
jgi:hypothetical protein